jgi:hypothetical protein
MFSRVMKDPASVQDKDPPQRNSLPEHLSEDLLIGGSSTSWHVNTGRNIGTYMTVARIEKWSSDNWLIQFIRHNLFKALDIVKDVAS